MTEKSHSVNHLIAQNSELRQALASEREQNQQLKQKVQGQLRILACVNHELRTSIGAIISMAELLGEEDLTETQAHYISTLHSTSQTLLTITSDIVNYAQLNTNQFQIHEQAFDLFQFMKEVKTSIMPRAEKKKIKLHISKTSTCPQYIMSDRPRLHQILTNLIDNALKFTAKGFIEVHVDVRDKEDENLYLHFDVIDTGIGISKADQARLFQPFAQGNDSISFQYGGTGLGLWISKRLAMLMQGDMSCVSEEGVGSQFSFFIRTKVTTKPEQKELQPKLCQKASRDKLGHILIVDDNELNQKLIQTHLEKLAIDYDIANDGFEAEELVRQNDYDLILMDIMMPVRDGIETTQCLRALPGKKHIPIVALTANTQLHLTEQYVKAGMNGYISKPLQTQTLYQLLNKFLPAADQDQMQQQTA